MSDDTTAPAEGAISLDSAVGLLTGTPDEREDAPPEARQPEDDIPDQPAEGDPAPTDEAASGEDDAGQDEPEPEAAPAIAPPASWTAEEKERFKQLPPETQAYLAQRESQREQFVSQKANEAALEKQAAAAERQQYQQGLESLGAMLQQAMQDDFAGIDWTALAQQDPADYVAKRAAFEQRQAQLAAVAQEHQRLEAIRQQEEGRQTAESLAREKEALVKALPEMADPAKAAAKVAAFKGYLGGLGFSDAEINSLSDHRALLLIDKAMKWEAAQTARAQAKKPVPQVQRPGAGSPTKPAANTATLIKSFERSRSPEAAAALLLQR